MNFTFHIPLCLICVLWQSSELFHLLSLFLCSCRTWLLRRWDKIRRSVAPAVAELHTTSEHRMRRSSCAAGCMAGSGTWGTSAATVAEIGKESIETSKDVWILQTQPNVNSDFSSGLRICLCIYVCIYAGYICRLYVMCMYATNTVCRRFRYIKFG